MFLAIRNYEIKKILTKSTKYLIEILFLIANDIEKN